MSSRYGWDDYAGDECEQDARDAYYSDKLDDERDELDALSEVLIGPTVIARPHLVLRQSVSVPVDMDNVPF